MKWFKILLVVIAISFMSCNIHKTLSAYEIITKSDTVFVEATSYTVNSDAIHFMNKRDTIVVFDLNISPVRIKQMKLQY